MARDGEVSIEYRGKTYTGTFTIERNVITVFGTGNVRGFKRRWIEKFRIDMLAEMLLIELVSEKRDPQ